MSLLFANVIARVSQGQMICLLSAISHSNVFHINALAITVNDIPILRTSLEKHYNESQCIVLSSVCL